METGHILVVDDDLDVLTSVRHALRKHRLQVDIAQSAADALALFERCRYALAIVDMHLGPESNGHAAGLELCEQLRRLDPKTKYLILSGHPDIEGAVRAIEIGAAGYLQKPVLPAKLLDAVQRAVTAGPTPTVDTWRRAVGKRIHLCRATRGLSLEQLGKRIDMSRSALSNIERGATNLKISVLREICLALDVKPHEVLDEAERELGWLKPDAQIA